MSEMRAIRGFYTGNAYNLSYLKWVILAAGQRIDNDREWGTGGQNQG